MQDLTNYKVYQNIPDFSTNVSNYTSIFQYPPEIINLQADNRECLVDLPFFVYDLKPEYTTDIESKILEQIANNEILNENVATEWALVQLFRSSPCRVMDPDKAKMFVVPYMHHADCYYTEGYQHKCRQIDADRIFHLMDTLKFYNYQRHRHLFIQGYDDSMSRKSFCRFAKLKLVTNKDTDRPSHIVIPVIHDEPKYQPSALLSRNVTWWTRPRKYSFAIIANIELNKKMQSKYQGRLLRQYFYEAIETMYTDKDFMEKPYVLEQRVPHDPFSVYRDSILCPVLPGDCPWQRRFFDVIRNGCIPVVFEWTLDDGIRKSWFTPFEPMIPKEYVYPFISETIPYHSFVVTAPGNRENLTDMSPILDAMESLLRNPFEIRRRQEVMMRYAAYLTFGFGPDAHMYKDGFYQILAEIKEQLDP